MTDRITAAQRIGRADERAAIVAWLRSQVPDHPYEISPRQDAMAVAAMRIEAGDHVRGGGGRALTWTTERPTKPGAYWVKDDRGMVDAVRFVDDGGLVTMEGLGAVCFVRFAGPLPEPSEPEAER